MAQRIQRKRAKGWRMPEGAVYVGRGTTFGNPFKVGGYFKIGPPGGGLFSMIWSQRVIWKPADVDAALREGYTLIVDRQMAADWFRRFVAFYPIKELPMLRGKSLACWCPLDQPCHADVLREIANA